MFLFLFYLISIQDREIDQRITSYEKLVTNKRKNAPRTSQETAKETTKEFTNSHYVSLTDKQEHGTKKNIIH